MKRKKRIVCSSHFDVYKNKAIVRCPDNDPEMSSNMSELEDRLTHHEECSEFEKTD